MKNQIILWSRWSKLALFYADKARKKILNYVTDFGLTEVFIKKIFIKCDHI